MNNIQRYRSLLLVGSPEIHARKRKRHRFIILHSRSSHIRSEYNIFRITVQKAALTSGFEALQSRSDIRLSLHKKEKREE